jgi:hypothetical protein
MDAQLVVHYVIKDKLYYLITSFLKYFREGNVIFSGLGGKGGAFRS